MRWLLSLLLLLTTAAAADAAEGMWRPRQLPGLAGELEALGLELDPRSLGDLTSHPMNAVISLGGCTASFVSSEGLVLTNHHCAESAILYNSTEERNLLEEGFLAGDRAAELPAAPGSRVLVTVEVEEVTDEILGGLPDDLGGLARFEAIERREKALISSCERDPGHRCAVRAYHTGVDYELIKQVEIRDVRLVYAPPRSIGVFGGDIDNWMWPRHTGDFALYRAWVGPDGRPADPAPGNVPYRPADSLRISTRGVEPGDLVLVTGYPGTTNRYRLAQKVADVFEWFYPTRKRVFDQWIAVLEEATRGSTDLEIKYAGLVSGLNNSSKNYEGMLKGFARSDMLDRKRRLEADLKEWISADPERRSRYLPALEGLEAVAAEERALRERMMFYDYLARRGELMRTATALYRLARERLKPDAERESGYQERDEERIRERLTRIERTYDPTVDRAFWRHHILSYAAIPADQHAAPFDDWFGIDGQQVDLEKLDARLDRMYAETGLGDLETRLGWMGRPPAELEASADPFLQLAVRLYDGDLLLEAEEKDREGRASEHRRRFMEALIAFLGSQGRSVYPDANSTLRVTYGTVRGYSPRDAVVLEPVTRLEGIVEKNTGSRPFDAPPEQLAAIQAKRHGRWADDRLGSVPVNFLSGVDTTGGNSGSPTLDARGELVGLLFDGNWESIISDWDFLPEITRSIHVDVRYMLWVMEELGGASHLLREMGIPPAE